MTSTPISPASDSPSPADVKARFSASWSEASQAADAARQTDTEPQLEQVPMPCPPGYVVWRIVGTQGRTMLPLLSAHAPARVVRGYFARVLSNLTGTCPNCHQVAWISADSPDPEHTPAGWERLDITFGVNHLPGCGAVFGDSDRRYFDSRAVPQQHDDHESDPIKINKEKSMSKRSQPEPQAEPQSEPQTEPQSRWDELQAEAAARSEAAVSGARRSDADTAIRVANAHLPAGEVS